MTIRRSVDRAELRDLLWADRFYAAYAIGVLEEASFAQTEWVIAEAPTPADEASAPESAPLRSALGLVYRGYQPSFTFLMGPSSLVEAVLAEGLRPYQTHFACRPSHLDEVRTYYRTGSEDLMIRMRVTAETFQPVPGQPVRLTGRHLNQLNRLYSHGVGAILTRRQIDEGIYYGIEDGSELIAVAGTHFLAPTDGLAAVGNVFTHPRHRDRGLATVCTSAVTAALLAHYPDVVLNVAAANEPARHAYQRLGYQDHCYYVEVFGTRRDGTSLRTLIHRVLGAE